MITVLATGGFDPLHSGHIEYLEAAAKLGDRLIVGVNSDRWLEKKKKRYFMNRKERMKIVSSLKCVDEVTTFVDIDGSAKDAIHKILSTKDFGDILMFANGGDRTVKNCPEWDEFRDNPRVVFSFGVGESNKKNSSSDLLKKWSQHDAHYVVPEIEKIYRSWGYYRVLEENPQCRVKELVIYPRKTISMQRHFKRSEFWFVKSGFLQLSLGGFTDSAYVEKFDLSKNQTWDIGVRRWHSAHNPHTVMNCRVIEIQHGELCVEEDIERATKWFTLSPKV